MVAKFSNRAVGWLLRIFRRHNKEITAGQNFTGQTGPQNTSLPENIKLRLFLFRQSKPIGYARSRKYPDIRRIQVENFSEAYRFFIRLCDQRLIAIKQKGENLHFTVKNARGSVMLDFTDKTLTKPTGTVAVLQIKETELPFRIAEIEFIQKKIRNQKNENT